MREAGHYNYLAHEEMKKHLKPGVTTEELDKICYDFCIKNDCYPSCLHYEGYPKSVCISINDEVVHGIPNKHRILQEGDIVSLDAGMIYKGYHSDAARTHGVGKISPEAQKLIDVTRESFFAGIKQAKAGNRLYDISNAIAAYVKPYGYGIVRDLVGHGVGTKLHEDPQIPNYAMTKRGPKLRPGMTLAIEPMVNLGTADVRWMKDGWTVISADHSLSAHYENTILITEGEPEILTLRA